MYVCILAHIQSQYMTALFNQSMAACKKKQKVLDHSTLIKALTMSCWMTNCCLKKSCWSLSCLMKMSWN